jgi:hypothetical protein
VRVSSPIGDLPFEPRALRLRAGSLQIDGVMGAWPAQVSIGLSDVPALLRLLAKPAAVVGAVLAFTGAATLVRPGRPPSRKERR